MNAHNLNQSGAKILDKGLQPGDRVYFYRPPSQHEVIRRGRKANPLSWSRHDSRQGRWTGQTVSYHLRWKSFKRDVSMLVPERDMSAINPEVHDPTTVTPNLAKPAFHARKQPLPLREEDIILCKTEKDDTFWCLAEVNRIFPDEVEVIYYTTPKPLMEGYTTATLHQRADDLLKARFRKTWYV